MHLVGFITKKYIMENLFWTRPLEFKRNNLTAKGRSGHEGVEWIHLARVRGKWRAPVNVIMKLRTP